MSIIQNAIECLICNQIVVSSNRYDYKTCTCGNVAVDGGIEYFKRAIIDKTKIIDLSLTTSSSENEIYNNQIWGTYGKDGKLPLTYKRVKDLDTDHLKAIITIHKTSERVKRLIKRELRIRNISDLLED